MNSWAARSTSSPLTEPEKLTATAEAPALAMVPSQSSSSWEPSAYAFNLVQVPALPPDTEETAMLEEETFTTSTKASPALCGSTERVVTPEPAVVAKPPTAEIVAEVGVVVVVVGAVVVVVDVGLVVVVVGAVVVVVDVGLVVVVVGDVVVVVGDVVVVVGAVVVVVGDVVVVVGAVVVVVDVGLVVVVVGAVVVVVDGAVVVVDGTVVEVVVVEVVPDDEADTSAPTAEVVTLGETWPLGAVVVEMFGSKATRLPSAVVP